MIETIQDELPGYGYRRVTHKLGRCGHLINYKPVAGVIRAEGLGIKLRRRFVRTTDNHQVSPIFPNLYRNIIPERPNIIWVADFTSIRIKMGFCYLPAILDACSRKVVDDAIYWRIDTPLALAALDSAVQSRKPPPSCIQHTDCESHYASEPSLKVLQDAGLCSSMSAPGNPCYNAQAESFVKTLKIEDV